MKLAGFAVLGLSLCQGFAQAQTTPDGFVIDHDSGFKQKPNRWPKATLDYAAYREEDSTPTFGLLKVKDILGSYRWKLLPGAEFAALSVGEKFTYCMLHGEVPAQSCAGMPIIAGEENFIFARPAQSNGDMMVWSRRQRQFIDAHRAEAVDMLRATIKSNNRVGRNVKQAIVAIHAYSLIPDMLAVYATDHKDHDILSIFCVLMKNAKYRPFLKSDIYQRLYGNPDTSYKSYVNADKSNQKMMTSWAMAFYKGRKG